LSGALKGFRLDRSEGIDGVGFIAIIADDNLQPLLTSGPLTSVIVPSVRPI